MSITKQLPTIIAASAISLLVGIFIGSRYVTIGKDTDTTDVPVTEVIIEDKDTESPRKDTDEAEPIPVVPEETTKPASATTQTATGIKINKFQTCRDVINRNPQNPSDTFSRDIGRVYCFVELDTDRYPTTIYHRWIFGGRVKYEHADRITKGPRWRTWSSKKIDPSWTGEWAVELVTESGVLLGKKPFHIE